MVLISKVFAFSEGEMKLTVKGVDRVRLLLESKVTRNEARCLSCQVRSYDKYLNTGQFCLDNPFPVNLLWATLQDTGS